MRLRNLKATFATGLLTVVENFHRSCQGDIPTDPLSDQETVKSFGRILSDMESNQLFISNRFYMVYSDKEIVDSKDGDAWTLDDRHNVRAALRNAIEACGWRYLEFAMARHPLDIFISNVHRFKYHSPQKALKRQIKEYFALVDDLRNKGMPVVRYEDICVGNTGPLTKMLEGFDIPPANIAKALKIPHAGMIDRWMLDKSKDIALAAQELSPLFAPHGYSFDSTISTTLPWTVAGKLLKKLLTEIRNINQIVRGNYQAHSAFVRHRMTRLSAIYLRVLILWPPFWRNYKTLYRDFYGNSIPMRSLVDILSRKKK